jgi:hypothetical protein
MLTQDGILQGAVNVVFAEVPPHFYLLKKTEMPREHAAIAVISAYLVTNVSIGSTLFRGLQNFRIDRIAPRTLARTLSVALAEAS